MKHAVTVAILCLCGAISVPGEQTGRLVFKRNGFSIAPLDEPGKGVCHVLIMMLPGSGSGGSPPSVTVETQQFMGTLEDHLALSRKRFESANFSILAQRRVGKDAYVIEFSMKSTLHHYTKAVMGTGKVYVVSGMATEEQWKDVSEKIMACVDSFETIKGNEAPQGNTKLPAAARPRVGIQPPPAPQ
jgi:hypothetical protein